MLYNLYDDNTLKALKNAYSLARLINDCEMLKKISPILVSPINSLSSCKSDLAVIGDGNEFGLNIYYNKDLIRSHIGTVILKLATYYLNDLPDNLFSKINSLADIYINEEFVKRIENINDIIKNIVNKNSLEYIRKNNINLKKYYP